MFNFIKKIFKRKKERVKTTGKFIGTIAYSNNPEHIITGGHERVGDYCNTCKAHIFECPYHRHDFE